MIVRFVVLLAVFNKLGNWRQLLAQVGERLIQQHWRPGIHVPRQLHEKVIRPFRVVQVKGVALCAEQLGQVRFGRGLGADPVQPALVAIGLNQRQQRIGFAAIADHNP